LPEKWANSKVLRQICLIFNGSAPPRGRSISAPDVERARWQRRDFPILEACFRRAYASTIDAVEPSFGDWVRTHAIRVASTGPAAHAWVHDELARSSEPSRATGFFTLGTQLDGLTLVRGGSRRFTESHLASVRKIVLDADTMFIPDPNLPWVESARLRKQGTEGCSCLGGGSRLAEMPKQG
jgi:hypothetical protein